VRNFDADAGPLFVILMLHVDPRERSGGGKRSSRGGDRPQDCGAGNRDDADSEDGFQGGGRS
jgi:hypothetical protein